MAEKIDVELFNKNFSKEFRIEMQLYRYEFLEKIGYAKILENTGKYQTDLMHYGDRQKDLPKELIDIDDLYPPNLAVLDFMLKNLDEVKNYIMLDHGCGLGILSVYLNKIGIRCYNYDNWAHFITKENTKDFLSKFNLQDSVIEIEEIKSLNINMFSSIGILSKASDFGQFKYVFSDTKYTTDMSGISNKSRLTYESLVLIYIM